MLAGKHPEEALAWCRRAAELRPHEPRYAYTLAFFQNQQGKTADAMRTLEELIQQEPAHADAYALLSRIYETQNRMPEAIAVCRRAAANPKLSDPDRVRFQARIRALTSESPKPY